MFYAVLLVVLSVLAGWGTVRCVQSIRRGASLEGVLGLLAIAAMMAILTIPLPGQPTSVTLPIDDLSR